VPLQEAVKHSDKYVAFEGNLLHVIASGTSLTEVHNKLKEKDYECNHSIFRRLAKP
jgi:hypothetical protein